MNLLSLKTLVPLAVETVKAPRPTFARLLSLDIPSQALWQALLLVLVVSVLLAEATNLLLAAALGPAEEPLMLAGPLIFGAIQLAVLVASVFLIYHVGRLMGGDGSFAGGILAVTWLQFLMVCLQVVQSVLILVLPGLAALVVIAGLVLFLWLLTNFVAELHGFASLGRVFGMIFFVLIGIGLVLSLLLTLSGVTVQPS